MLKFLNKIEKVSTCFPLKDGLYAFFTNKELSKFDNKDKREWTLLVDTIHVLFGKDENLLFSYTKGLKSQVIIKGEVRCDLAGYSPLGYLKNDILFFYNGREGRRICILEEVSHVPKNQIDLGPSMPQYNIEEKIIGMTSKVALDCHDFSKQKKLWEIDLKEKLNLHDPTIYKHVAFGGYLYVYINDDRNPDKSHVYCIDLETGEIVAEFPDFKGYVSVFDRYIYTTRYSFIQRFNPETKVLENIDIEKELKKNGFREMDFTRWLVKDNYMYFVQNFGDVQARVGIVDLSTQTIVDKIVLDRKNGSIGTIKVHNNRLYILSQDSTLHIYEAERKTSSSIFAE